MAIDTFSDISSKRFEHLREDQIGRRVMLFPYLNHAEGLPSPLVGLWLSEEYVFRQIETVHYMPDDECRRTLSASGSSLPGSVCVWQGLKIEFNAEKNPVARLYLPFYMEEDYGRLVVDKEKTFTQELEERFKISITLA
ncbi:hypothetical protein KC960_04060 [Candidatus Saccharibacteria bacterium]|nr:hypothetical protein [Candidatus Saccharibacteria bacterium]